MRNIYIALAIAIMMVSIECQDPSSCSSNQYFDPEKKCTACPENCNGCQYHFASKKPTCNDCADNFFLDGASPSTCQKCADNCKICSSAAAKDCLVTKDGFKLNPETNTIVSCNIDKCLYCGAADTCAKCWVGFLASADSKSCTACTDAGCASCVTAAGASTQTCNTCAVGYYKDNKGTCLKCADNCVHCQDDKTCLFCEQMKDGFAITKNGGTCTKCIEFCLECSATDKCEKCAVGATFDATSKTCKFPEACKVSGCKTCVAGDTGKCDKCNDGFYGNTEKTTCTVCPDGCDTCTAADKCTKCKVGFFANDKGTCDKCPKSGCIACTKDACTQCQPAMALIAGECKPCKEPTCLECNPEDKCNKCPMFQIINGAGCTACADTGCADCKGDAKTCLSCKEGFMKSTTCKPINCGSPYNYLQKEDKCDTTAPTTGNWQYCVFGENLTPACTVAALGYVIVNKAVANCPVNCKTCSLNTTTSQPKCDSVASKLTLKADNVTTSYVRVNGYVVSTNACPAGQALWNLRAQNTVTCKPLNTPCSLDVRNDNSLQYRCVDLTAPVPKTAIKFALGFLAAFIYAIAF